MICCYCWLNRLYGGGTAAGPVDKHNNVAEEAVAGRGEENLCECAFCVYNKHVK